MATHRTHDFEGLQFGDEPSVDELLALLDHLDDDHERQRLRLYEVLDWFEGAVTAQVAAERRRDELTAEVEAYRARVAELEAHEAALLAEVHALHGSLLFRAARPVRSLWAKVRRRG